MKTLCEIRYEFRDRQTSVRRHAEEIIELSKCDDDRDARCEPGYYR